MYLCLCRGIKTNDIKGMTNIELEYFLEGINYKERCHGCLDFLKEHTKGDNNEDI